MDDCISGKRKKSYHGDRRRIKPPIFCFSSRLLTSITMSEKHSAPLPGDLPLPSAQPTKNTSATIKTLRKTALAALILGAYYLGSARSSSLAVPVVRDLAKGGGACYQAEPLLPTSEFFGELDKVWKSEDFKNQAIEWLGGAVRVETERFVPSRASEKRRLAHLLIWVVTTAWMRLGRMIDGSSSKSSMLVGPLVLHLVGFRGI